MNMNATLIGQAITFLLFVWFCMRFVWPPLMKAIEKRQKEITDSLSSAELARKESDLLKSDMSDLIETAKSEAQSIIEQANKRKSIIIEEARQEAQKEKEKILSQGFAEVADERQKTREELRKKLATLTIMGAEKIIDRSLDQAANNDIIDKLVAEL